MSRANLKAVPDSADAITSRLRERLNRLFDGLTIKTLSPNLDHEWIDMAVFGQAEDLMRHGLLTADLLQQLPKGGVKRFSSVPALGDRPVMVRRGKAGIGFSTYWFARCHDDDEAWRHAPPWIQSALRELLALKDSKQSTANRGPEAAAESDVKTLSPEEWRQDRLSQLRCYFRSVIPLLGDPNQWRASNELDGNFDANRADVSAYTALAQAAAKDLERALRSMRICRAKTSALKLVVNNT